MHTGLKAHQGCPVQRLYALDNCLCFAAASSEHEWFGLQGTNSVLSCTWNKPATKLIVGSVDHNLRVYGLDSE